MTSTNILTYGPMLAAILALIIKWNGMKKFIPAGLFACFYATIVCHIAMALNWWTYPNELMESIVNCILVPVSAMFWIRYAPPRLSGLIIWNLLWSSILAVSEFYAERFTNVIKYYNEYDWYYSFVLWIISWFVWYAFHIWFNDKDVVV